MKHLSLLITSVILILCPLFASAQTITLQQGEKGNSRFWGYEIDHTVIDLAPTEGHFFTLMPSYNAFGKPKELLFEEVDGNYGIVRSLMLPDTKSQTLIHSQMSHQQMHIITCIESKKSFALRHLCIDLESFTIVADSLLAEETVEKKCYPITMDDASPSRNRIGLVYAIVNEKSGQAKVRAMMFDSEMHRLWDAPLQASGISQIFTTDDGRLATGDIHYSTSDSDPDILEFTLTESGNTQRGLCPVDHQLDKLAILNVQGNQVVATALETSNGIGWAGSLTAGAVVTNGVLYSGIASFLFDMDANKMVNSNRHEFTKDDARAFTNTARAAAIASPSVNFMQLRAQATLPSGGAALYGRMWTETVVSKSGTTVSINYKGMMLVRVDEQGNIAYIRTLPHDNQFNGDFGRQLTETDLLAEGDDLYIVTNESASDPDTYNPTQPVKKMLFKGHGSIAVYRFSPDGNAEKTKLPTEHTSAICTPLRPQGGGIYTFTTAKRYGIITQLTIPTR